MTTMQQLDPTLVNEFRKLERRLASNKSKLDQIKARFKAKKGTLLDRRPKRYSTEFNFVPGSLQSQQQTFTVDGGTVFYCTEVAASVRIVGSALIENPPGITTGQTVNVTRPYGVGISGAGNAANYRNEFFDFDWRIVDTSEDREWQNIQQPAPFLGTGAFSGMELPRAAKLRGGAKVLVEIDPHYSMPFAVAPQGLFTAVRSFVVHFSFFGFEVLS